MFTSDCRRHTYPDICDRPGCTTCQYRRCWSSTTTVPTGTTHRRGLLAQWPVQIHSIAYCERAGRVASTKTTMNSAVGSSCGVVQEITVRQICSRHAVGVDTKDRYPVAACAVPPAPPWRCASLSHRIAQDGTFKLSDNPRRNKCGGIFRTRKLTVVFTIPTG